MKQSLIVFTLLGFSLTALAQKTDTRYFEMRTYHCNENKRPDLIRRFEDHTLRLLEKHGITNVAYFIPTDENNNSLTFFLAYPDKASRDVRWNISSTIRNGRRQPGSRKKMESSLPGSTRPS